MIVRSFRRNSLGSVLFQGAGPCASLKCGKARYTWKQCDAASGFFRISTNDVCLKFHMNPNAAQDVEFIMTELSKYVRVR